MSANSNLVLRCDLDKPARENCCPSEFKDKLVSSFTEGGFKWTVAVYDWKNVEWKVKFNLNCEVDHNVSWRSEGEVEFHPLLRSGSKASCIAKSRFCFDENIRSWVLELKSDFPWTSFYDLDYITRGKFSFEARIKIISPESLPKQVVIKDDKIKFDSPSNRSDVILLIGDKKLHVSKEMLSIHSPVFETLFYGNFAENGKGQVELKDVVYEEFLDLLNLIYLGIMNITDDMVLYIVKLADRYQMKRLLDQSVEHLIQSSKLDIAQKFILADQYRLTTLRDHCLDSFSTVAELADKLKHTSHEYANFSGETKIAICDRMMELNTGN